MSFFKWTPEDSTQVISPWIVLYLALTVIVTTVIIWRWRAWTALEDAKTDMSLQRDLEIEKGPTHSEESVQAPQPT